jgi:hypothetical protein
MKSVHKLLISGILLLAISAPAASQTETTSVDYMPPNTAEGVLRPTAGLSQDQVLNQFGEPLQRVAPVGEPPISRWVYDLYTVYFEHQYVIHSVVHKK